MGSGGVVVGPEIAYDLSNKLRSYVFVLRIRYSLATAVSSVADKSTFTSFHSRNLFFEKRVK